ncbi:SPOR domain-containing protein [Altererythrobacter sp. SALINAS58]|uniref:SPOR domain-containing protein n=1 Tax=Alteripontixanthobacter muriae TaxID=2705546 RepID=UPI00157558EA|nr:SPOR domain-containing protein [Alteripontixanthobacter muriae]NTZ42314.1 SPOR domain-containing protein [Alteripontixanthobacter muriae]
MTGTNPKTRRIALAATTALATLALGGCATSSAPRADLSAAHAQKEMAQGNHEKAVAHAEAAVQAEPRNAAYRTMLGAAYMDAGRFASAATSFEDALELGDDSARTALSLALAYVAQGEQRAALDLLDEWAPDIAPADLGLALALAGEPDRGVQILGDALRAGETTVKLRQNLAYAYALQGNWSGAKIMAAEDVPAGQLDARIAEWAKSGRPDQAHLRIANVLQVPVIADAGQPAALALSNNPGPQQLVAEAAEQMAQVEIPNTPPAAQYAEVRPAAELPPIPTQSAAPAFTPAAAVKIAAAPQPVATEAAAKPAGFTKAFASSEIVQPIPARQPAAREAPKQAPRTASSSRVAGGSHLVQLGSFGSEDRARRAWDIYADRYPELRNHDMVITRALVRGKTYYRVSAGGLRQAAASSMCASVKASGHGCFTWAEGKPLPGALDQGVRMARR